MLLQHKKMPRMRGHRVNYVKDVVSCWNEVKSRVNKLMVDQKKLSTLSAIATASFLPPECMLHPNLSPNMKPTNK